jgi:hypothetical protein
VGVAVEAAAVDGELGEVEHPARTVEVDRPRFVERKGEGNRGGGVDDRGHTLGQLVAPRRLQPEPRRRELSGDCVYPPGIPARAHDAEQIAHGGVDAGSGGRVVGGAHQAHHAAISALEVARQHLHPDKAGAAGEQDIAA